MMIHIWQKDVFKARCDTPGCKWKTKGSIGDVFEQAFRHAATFHAGLSVIEASLKVVAAVKAKVEAEIDWTGIDAALLKGLTRNQLMRALRAAGITRKQWLAHAEELGAAIGIDSKGIIRIEEESEEKGGLLPDPKSKVKKTGKLRPISAIDFVEL